jgi:hypothetical protein
VPTAGRDVRVAAALAGFRGLGDDAVSEAPDAADSLESAAAIAGVDAPATFDAVRSPVWRTD